MKSTFAMNPRRVEALVRKGLAQMSPEERAGAGIPAASGEDSGIISRLARDPARIQALVRRGLAHMSPEERAGAGIPVLGANEAEIRNLVDAARRGARQSARAFEPLRAFCLFIGYPRSGHSLIGSLLDAHENIVIAHELNALKFIDVADFGGPELYWLMLENSRLFAEFGRRWAEYAYQVPGQYQGTFRELRVIGDKKGGGTTRLLHRKPQLLDRLRAIVPLPLRVIHVTRNPFDSIATMARKDSGTIERAAEFYLSLCEANRAIIGRLGSDTVMHLRHEDIIGDPRGTLASLCGFLGVPAGADYLSACAGIVSERPGRARDGAAWSAPLRGEVEAAIARYPFLSRYSFDS